MANCGRSSTRKSLKVMSSSSSSSLLPVDEVEAILESGGCTGSTSRPANKKKAGHSASSLMETADEQKKKKRLFSELDPTIGFLEHEPKLVRTTLEEKACSDFFLASKSKYKSRSAKFLREVQGDKEIKGTEINQESRKSNKMKQLNDKSRFSFKNDGVCAVNQVIDSFCQGFVHEAKRAARKRQNMTYHDDEKGIVLVKQDLVVALKVLGWDRCIEAVHK